MKYLIFPDQTKIKLHPTLSILDKGADYSCVAYVDENAGSQTLWVPNTFIVEENE